MTQSTAPATIRRIASSFSGTLGLAARDFDTGEEVLLNADVVFPTASMIKIAILLELFRQREAGKLELDEMLTVRPRDKTAGSGLLENMGQSVTLSVHDLAVLMNTISDNTATNLLIDRLGLARINRAIRDAGMTRTRLFRKIAFDKQRRLKYPQFAAGTPRDFMTLMSNLYAGRLLSDENTQAMLNIMRVQKYMGNLTRYIPFNPWARASQDWVASKTGSILGVRNETGILHTRRGAHVISVMTKGCKDKKWTADNEGTLAVAEVSRGIYDHFYR
jgi:beta-lactamase class A